MNSDTLTIVGTAFSVIGAGGVLYALLAQARKTAREMLRRRQTRGTLKDYYYRYQYTGLRIVQQDREYLALREVEVVSRRDGLEGVLWGNRVTGDVQVAEETLSPPGLTFAAAEEGTGIFEAWVRRKVCFDHPMQRDASRTITHMQRMAVTGAAPMRPYLGWSAHARVDRVEMQVAFSANPPARAHYSELASDGTTIYTEALKLDPVTSSYKRRIDNPLPGRYYYIKW